MRLGIENLLSDQKLLSHLKTKRVAMLAHPASVSRQLKHSIDALQEIGGIKLACAFGPQHGIRGDLQDNMRETPDQRDPKTGLMVYSLYGEVRRPTKTMMESFDILLVDVQDIGCRIYTYVTTLLYMMEACAQYGKEVWILDRPNPAGRAIEGTVLKPGWESFVGAGPLMMRHGLTLGEIGVWFQNHFKLGVDLKVVEMEDYFPDQAPGFGWPVGDLTWVNPSPNASSLSMARCFSGTVLLEGTELSEGRGTTHPLEMMGAPDLDPDRILKTMFRLAPQWMEGCRIRTCSFLPTFQKHQDKLCHGFQIHTDGNYYNPIRFKPYRLMALFLKSIRTLSPEYKIWRKFHYEYETERLAIDLLSGGTWFREWVDNAHTSMGEFDEVCSKDESFWREHRRPFEIY